MAETLRFEREYPVPPERVFAAWSTVDVLTRWFGCGPDMLWTVHEWDVRVGGAIRVSLDFDAGPFEVKGEFLVVEPPRRLTYRWSGDQVVDVRIDPHGSGSRLRLEHAGLDTDQECAVTDAGWTFALDRLAEVSRP